MDPLTRVRLLTTNLMVMVRTLGQQRDEFTLVTGQKIECMDKARSNTRMDECIMVASLREKSMGMAASNGPTIVSTAVITAMIRSRVTVFLSGPTEENMSDNGFTASSTAPASTYLPTERGGKANGTRVSSRTGSSI